MISVEDVQQRALLDIHCVAVVPIKLKGPFYSITKNHMLVIKSALVSGFTTTSFSHCRTLSPFSRCPAHCFHRFQNKNEKMNRVEEDKKQQMIFQNPVEPQEREPYWLIWF